MIAFGLAYAWCIVQVTVLTGAVIALYFGTGRTRPVFRSYVVSTGLGLVLALSLLMLSPWPRWTGLPEPAKRAAASSQRDSSPPFRNDRDVRPKAVATEHDVRGGAGPIGVVPAAGPSKKPSMAFVAEDSAVASIDAQVPGGRARSADQGEARPGEGS